MKKRIPLQKNTKGNEMANEAALCWDSGITHSTTCIMPPIQPYLACNMRSGMLRQHLVDRADQKPFLTNCTHIPSIGISVTLPERHGEAPLVAGRMKWVFHVKTENSPEHPLCDALAACSGTLPHSILSIGLTWQALQDSRRCGPARSPRCR